MHARAEGTMKIVSFPPIESANAPPATCVNRYPSATWRHALSTAAEEAAAVAEEAAAAAEKATAVAEEASKRASRAGQ